MNQEKINSFLEEYGELVKKHNIDFASYPVFIPDGNGGFKIVCQSVPIDLTAVQNAQKSETETKEFVAS